MIAVQQSARTARVGTARDASPLAGTRLWNSPYLSRDEQRVLEEAASPASSVAPNVDLVREGYGTDRLLVVTEGWVCRYTTTQGGGRQFPAIILPGDVGNLDSLLFERLDFSVRTLTRASVVALSCEQALALAAQHPGIAQTFIWLALVENAILGKWALSLGRRSSKERLAHLLCELSVRLDAVDGNESHFAFPITQEQLADSLGLTAVHVNRMMQYLRAEGLVVIADRIITLPDVESLRRIGGFDPAYLHLDRSVATQLA